MTAAAQAYFKPLNGFRGLAAIFILLFHSLFPCFKALWIGVPMFFVLSGFLITRILVESKSSEKYLTHFYLKRSLRIFPVYYLALAVSVLWCFLVKGDFNLLPYFVFYLQNFPISLDVTPEYCYGLMNHTWSLSVEELFYLAWPLIVLFCTKRSLLAACLITGAFSVLCKLILIGFFYTPLTDQFLMLSFAGNLDALMAGASLGILSLDKDSFFYKVFPRKMFLFFSIGFVLLTVLYYQPILSGKSFSVVQALVNIFAVACSVFLIAWCSSPVSASRLRDKLFNWPFLQFTGKISYALYLYHALVYGIAEACVYHFNLSIHPVLLFVIKLLITYGLAVLSWQLIEAPLLKLKNRLSQRSA